MSNQTDKPIIFLAFANDRQADGTYLRNLGQEAEQLREVLASAEKAGLCQVETRTSVSAEGILKRFNDPTHKGRIALFHYAGHADDYDLLLESATGERAIADGRGLAAFLRQQNGLQLVFLNACSTRTQVEGLLDAGIAAVIATSRAIDDQTASDFARHFYTALAGGDSISAAFEKAQAALHFVRGDLTRHLRPQQDPHAEHSAAGWPWALYLRKGAEEVAAWNLPGAANDPLFGLDLPAIDLPVAPYPEKLQWYDATYAPVFFGRGQDIRALYNRVTANGGDPIILFYGQSGVGKSSLLAAGLMPRLAAQQSVVYCRRDQNKGLLGSLIAALADTSAPTPTGVDVLDLWLQRERALGKPLTILLDQVEELYTRSASAQPNELADFLTALRILFLDPAQRPQGKLILGFRKEWLAEIDKQLADAHLSRTAVFLRRMDGRGVVEAVLGPTSTPRLQQKYGLQVEAGLAEEIARDLVKDAEAAVAPTLQILLSKLWAEAKQINRTQPHYDRALYDRLRGEGYLLKDFLDQQLKELHAEHAAAVTSGLALDLLAFHTSEHGAAERTRQTLHDTYQHVQATVDGLLQSFQRRYLLVDLAPDQENPARPTRLAHDTLAPLVRARFDESDLPGQRARRILENRASEWDGIDDPIDPAPLDRQDLGVVEAGEAGMRAWKESEQKLIEASWVARHQLEQRERWIRRVLWAAAIAILLVAGIAGWQWRVAVKNEARAEREAAIARARQWAAQAALEYEANPLLGLRLALEAREFFPGAEATKPAALTAAIHTYMDNGRIATLGREVTTFHRIPGATWIIVNLVAGEPSQLRSMADGGLIEQLAGRVNSVFSVSADAPIFVVNYADDTPGELRSTSDGSLMEQLAGRVNTASSVGEDVPFFVVTYADDTPGELRSKSDGSLIITSVSTAWVEPNVSSRYFFIRRSNQHTELWQVAPTQRLVDLDFGVAGDDINISSPDSTRNIQYDREHQTLSMRYADGHAYLVDMDWIESMQSDPNSLDDSQLRKVACMPFGTRAFDEHLLANEEYLGDATPHACTAFLPVWQGRALARQGDLEGALAKFAEAQVLDPALVIDPQREANRQSAASLTRKVIGLARRGEITASLAAISQALQLDPQVVIDADTWHSLCRSGSLHGLAKQVLSACEEAVAAAPKNGGIHDSRGLARALTGDREGALEDFKFFVEANPDRNFEMRKEVIRRLEAGEDPALIFDAALLEQLKNE